MKQRLAKLAVFTFFAALVSPASLLAQDEEKDKEVKKDVEQIVIVKKGDATEKIVVEIIGDKVTVNGKPMEEFKDKDGNITVKRHKYKTDYEGLLSLARTPGGFNWNKDGNDILHYFNEESNRAMLGVTTEKAENGVKVTDVTKESAAEKIGLKSGDIITGVDDKKIADPDDLSKVIREHKPGDKVSVTYQRDKKEQKATAELTKWKGANAWAIGPGGNFDIDLGDLKIDKTMPRLEGLRAPYSQNWNWSGGSPKLGLSVQDTDDGKGVKVIEVDDESHAAKAGIKKDDVITEVDGKAMNSTDDMVKMIRSSKDKTSVMVKLLRNGKTQNIEVKMPRKIKTADL